MSRETPKNYFRWEWEPRNAQKCDKAKRNEEGLTSDFCHFLRYFFFRHDYFEKVFVSGVFELPIDRR
jgi:hypothetical protein